MISCIDNQPTGPSVPHRTDLQAEFFTPAREPEIKQRWGPPRDACRIGSPLLSSEPILGRKPTYRIPTLGSLASRVTRHLAPVPPFAPLPCKHSPHVR